MSKKLTKKIVFVVAVLFLIAIFIIGLIQSITLNSLLKEKLTLEQQHTQILNQHEFLENSDYQDAYALQEGNKGHEEDEIYKSRS